MWIIITVNGKVYGPYEDEAQAKLDQKIPERIARITKIIGTSNTSSFELW